MGEQSGLELRILSGLHRGASLPLGGERYVIGASDDADVVLLDPGVADRHATLRHDGERWLLAALEGSVRGAASDAELEEYLLAPGDSARIGAVWVGIADAAASWGEPPPAPPPAVAGHGAGAGAGQDARPAAQVPPPSPGKPGKRRSRAMWVPVAAGTVLAGVASLAFSARSAPTPVMPPAPAALAVVPPASKPTPAALAQAFRKRLADVDMLRRFDLQLDEGEWRMKGALDEEETLRFRRILADFVKANDIKFPIDVQLGGADTLLPFQIQQLVTGNQASIVTSDGQRLYPGDEYKGVRLTAIDGNRITFAGRGPIEVRW
ncbi:type III secretion protein D [Duganella sp. CF458]|uniref:FHA domain-containing protein n=1 Tax=Duganella sp. CF458 TaxID=1884368 RepID=UPI0008E60733|nr:FHA domain-containing protein [Duganella sp. CF458]SFF95503.1 type III secretion protein D [Duganella sp. CF458]